MTAFTLKTIAITSMLLDHLAVVFPDIFPFWFRGIGRLAWPIFAYLLADGFRHTKSPEKFLMRLLAFAVISEIPYDLAMGNNISFISNTNIFYTLFLGGMAIRWFEKMKNWYGWQAMAALGSLLPTAILAEVITADYGGLGVFFIFTMYAIKPMTMRLFALGGFILTQFIPLLMAYTLGIEIRFEYLLMIPLALAAVPLIASYNGQRGTQAKWLFYMAYPAHLTVLAVTAALINYSSL